MHAHANCCRYSGLPPPVHDSLSLYRVPEYLIAYLYRSIERILCANVRRSAHDS